MQKLSHVAIMIMAACVVVLTGVVVHREFLSVPVPKERLAIRDVADWERFGRHGHTLGSEAAPIKIVEFSDFECPFCGAAADSLRRIVEQSNGRIAVIYRYFPLTQIHPHSLQAAVAAECAADQGQFEAYHDALFRFQDSLGAWPWSRYAQLADIADIVRFETCVANQRTTPEIERDRSLADSLHLTGTPSFIAGGKLFLGMPPASIWQKLLRMQH